MQIKVEGKTLIVTMQLDAQGELSDSEKNYVIASTHGFKPVEGVPGVTLSVNLCRKNEAYKKSK